MARYHCATIGSRRGCGGQRLEHVHREIPVRVRELEVLDAAVEALDDRRGAGCRRAPIAAAAEPGLAAQRSNGIESPDRGVGMQNGGALLELVEVAASLQVLGQFLDRRQIARRSTLTAGVRGRDCSTRQLDQRLDVAAHQLEVVIGPVGRCCASASSDSPARMLIDGMRSSCPAAASRGHCSRWRR